MSEIIIYSGIYYQSKPSFFDRINLSDEFESINYDDNELLKFYPDEFGRLSIIELSNIPFIDYNYFNWEFKDYDSEYKWYYFGSGNISYKLYPSGINIPFNIPPNDDFWTLNSYFIENINGAGYFKYNTFSRIDFIEPTGWINSENKYPVNDYYTKPKYDELLQNQYKPIQLLIGTDRTTQDYVEGIDKTKYKENEIPILDRNYVNSTQTLQYYFDGKNLVTNYNFSDPEIQKNVHVIYNYLPNKFKLVAKLYTNENGFSEYTPLIDDYTIKMSTQRINK